MRARHADGRSPWGLIDRGAPAVIGRLFALGWTRIDLGSGWISKLSMTSAVRWITPGLIDAHTHLIYAGQRASDSSCGSKAPLTSRSRRQAAGSDPRGRHAVASDEALLPVPPPARSAAGLRRHDGRDQSGYGLSLEHERRCLQAARRLGRERGVDVRTTCLAAHALPPESMAARRLHRRGVWLAASIARESLVRCGGTRNCERIAFSREQTARVFRAGATPWACP